ncbi:MAG: glycosyltransferase [Candidatus Hodarchaeota archaeon]
MKLAFFIPINPEHLNLGMGVRTITFAKYLHKRGIKIDIFNTIPLSNKDIELIKQNLNGYKNINFKNILNLNINSKDIYNYKYVFQRFSTIVPLFKMTMTKLTYINYDAFWIFTPSPQHMALINLVFYRKFFNSKMSPLILDWPMDYSLKTNELLSSIAFIPRFSLSNTVDGITLPNIELLPQVLLHRRKSKKLSNIFLVPHGIDTTKFAPINKNSAKDRLGLKDFIILRMGSYYRMPIDVLIPIVRELKKSLPNFKLVSIGGLVSDIERAKNLVRRFKMEDVVEIVGVVPEEKLPYYIAAADVCLYYDINVERLDLPTKLFYFMSMGKTILALRTKGIRNTFFKKSIFFVDSLNDFPNKIKKIYDNPDVIKNMEQTIRSESIMYDWNNVVDCFLNIIKDLTTS